MKRTVLLTASEALALLVAGGVAYAATIDSCPGRKNGQGDVCEGTPEDDTIHGGDLPNYIFGLAGDDTIYAGGGDRVEGGDDSDLIYGGPGIDILYPSDRFDKTDSSNDYVHGGRGGDTIRGASHRAEWTASTVRWETTSSSPSRGNLLLSR